MTHLSPDLIVNSPHARHTYAMRSTPRESGVPELACNFHFSVRTVPLQQLSIRLLVASTGVPCKSGSGIIVAGHQLSILSQFQANLRESLAI